MGPQSDGLKKWDRIVSMRKTLQTLATLAILFFTGTAHAQKATEIYIPIGKSPGLSGKTTVIGTIDSVLAQERTMTIRGQGRTWTVKIEACTDIWIDRSRILRTNLYGTAADCRPGRLVEIKFQDNRPRDGATCEWIKVQAREPSREWRDPQSKSAPSDATARSATPAITRRACGGLWIGALAVDYGSRFALPCL